MNQNKKSAIVPTVATDAMEQAAFEAAGSPSDWYGFQEMWRAALAHAQGPDLNQHITNVRDYLENSYGDEAARSIAIDAIASIEAVLAGIGNNA